jgi:thiamine pyrophosphokinase
VGDDLPLPGLIVAADGGYHLALAMGWSPDVVVGDLDSIEAEALDPKVVVERHSVDKDATDLELALELVTRESPERVVVIGGTGGRWDHELAVAGLLASARWAHVEELDWLSARGWAHVVRGRRMIHGDVGATISLVPIGGEAEGVTSTGLRWDLHDETLFTSSTRGVSNVFRLPVADIGVARGCLLAVLPEV